VKDHIPSHDWKIDFYQKVWDVVRSVPAGRVITYGGIAALISPPSNITIRGYYFLAPRWVGKAISECPRDVPWHRVINSKGKISYRKSGSHILQKELLFREGVKFEENGKISLTKYGWNANKTSSNIGN